MLCVQAVLMIKRLLLNEKVCLIFLRNSSEKQKKSPVSIIVTGQTGIRL